MIGVFHRALGFFLAVLVLVQSAGTAHAATTSSIEPRNQVITVERHTIVAIPLASIPTSITFRVLRHINESQPSVNNEWTSFFLGAYVFPLYRPDIGRTTPAYYEFEVYSDAARSKSAGFIMVTNNLATSKQSSEHNMNRLNPQPLPPHDAPIAHWNSKGNSVTRQLLRASKVGTGSVTLWKMDTLSYVATRSDAIIGNLGNIPLPLSGLTSTEFTTYSQSTKVSRITDTATQSANDNNYTGKFTRTTSGPAVTEVRQLFTFSRPSSFAQYLTLYTTGFASQIASLKTQNTAQWGYETQINPTGTSYSIPVPASSTFKMLIPFDTVTTSDVLIIDTNDIIANTPTVTRPSTQQFPVLTLQTGALQSSHGTASATISVRGAVKMSITFHLIDKNVGNSVVPPVTSKQSRSHGHYNWHTFNAGTDVHQRWYNQFTYGGCAVGCGSVAWMMLFGWIDFRSTSAGGSTYTRTCTFRASGSSTGSCTSNPDGIAPSTNTTGANNAIINIRNRINTFCSFGSGATAPWDMPNASGYLTQMRSGLSVVSNWNSVGFHEDSLKNLARNEIVNNSRPVIIGTGWLSHYPLAYRYRWYSRPENWDEGWGDGDDVTYVEQFYVNQGWGGPAGWVSAGTWFVGRVIP